MSAGLEIDTIAAIATAHGRGSVGIVRVSGPEVIHIAERVIGTLPKPRCATSATFLTSTAEVMDYGLALYFPAPHSYTGEDVLELQGHGGDAVLHFVLENVLLMGARLANPGEFSERAFLNGKMDLTQAEAIADLIDGSSKTAVKAALVSLSGKFSQDVTSLAGMVLKLRTLLEAHLDFPDEGDSQLDNLLPQDVHQQLPIIKQQLEQLIESSHQGRLMRDGVRVALIGRPNVGKSSLINYLSGQEASIVTDIPGTTRDVVRSTITLNGLTLHLADTAGLQEETKDKVESIGMEKALSELTTSDLILFMTAPSAEGSTEGNASDKASSPFEPGLELGIELDTEQKVLHIHNKIDLTGLPPGVTAEGCCNISLHTGEGLAALQNEMCRQVGFRGEQEGSFTARMRHVTRLQGALDCIQDAQAHLCDATTMEMLAEDLRLAHEALGQITGRVTTEDILGEIFSSFCIGK